MRTPTVSKTGGDEDRTRRQAGEMLASHLKRSEACCSSEDAIVLCLAPGTFCGGRGAIVVGPDRDPTERGRRRAERMGAGGRVFRVASAPKDGLPSPSWDTSPPTAGAKGCEGHGPFRLVGGSALPRAHGRRVCVVEAVAPQVGAVWSGMLPWVILRYRAVRVALG